MVAMASPRLLLLLVSAVLLFGSPTNAIYEDQVGVRDWYTFPLTCLLVCELMDSIGLLKEIFIR
jgi:hypothetical protein